MEASRSIIGFDSAWTDKPNAPGALCIIRSDESGLAFVEPQLTSFDQALAVIRQECARSEFCFVAVDQPTIVPNQSSVRPVERVAASVISWVGGGVQPANRSKIGMFDDDAPIWRFKTALGAIENPEAARTSLSGLYIAEVFPALALLSFEETFFARLKAPRYNPARRKTFRLSDWQEVLSAVAAFARLRGLDDVARWCEDLTLHSPRKADQDKLDSVICALVGWLWCSQSRDQSVMVGDLMHGYMISPCSPSVRERLEAAAIRYGVTVS